MSTAAYLVAVYSATGLLNVREGWMALLSRIPFLMLGRVTAGTASVAEVVLAIVLLIAAIGVALWIAARIYAAGVLL